MIKTNYSLSQRLTIIDALDTLWVMEQYDEFKLGRDWVANELTFDKVHSYFGISSYGIIYSRNRIEIFQCLKQLLEFLEVF